MKLERYMERHGLKDIDLSAKVGCDRSTISRIRRGKQLPDWQTMMDIMVETGEVFPDDFIPNDYRWTIKKPRKR
jgi:transcriptional regulator with XRE-family HTH domain